MIPLTQHFAVFWYIQTWYWWVGLPKGYLSFVESKYLQAFGEFAPCRREMSLVGLQCHWLISLYRDLQKYPCFCGFKWCTLRIFYFFIFFLIFKLRLPSILRLPWTNSFQGGQSCALYTPTFGLSYPLEALSLCTPCWTLLTICTLCWDVLWLVPIAGTCYNLNPLLVRATSCSHDWDMLTIYTFTYCWYVL